MRLWRRSCGNGLQADANTVIFQGISPKFRFRSIILLLASMVERQRLATWHSPAHPAIGTKGRTFRGLIQRHEGLLFSLIHGRNAGTVISNGADLCLLEKLSSVAPRSTRS